MQEPKILEFEGVCRGGRGACGFVLGDAFSEGQFVSERTTQLEAKVEGLVMGLRRALDLGLREVVARTSSDAIVAVMRGGGGSSSREEDSSFASRRAKALAARFDRFRIERAATSSGRALGEAARALNLDLKPLTVIVAFGSHDDLPFIQQGRTPRWITSTVEVVDPYANRRRVVSGGNANAAAFSPAAAEGRRRQVCDECEERPGGYVDGFSKVGVKAVTLERQHFGGPPPTTTPTPTTTTTTPTREEVYFLGGSDALQEGNVRVFEAQTSCWRRRAASQSTRLGSAVVASGGKIFQIGGKVFPVSDAHDFVASREVDVYDPDVDSWSRGPEVSYPRANTSAVATDGLVIVVGGTTSFFVEDFDADPAQTKWDAVREVEFLDVAAWLRGAAAPPEEHVLWSRLPPLPRALFAVGLVAFDSIVYALGGRAIQRDELSLEEEEEEDHQATTTTESSSSWSSSSLAEEEEKKDPDYYSEATEDEARANGLRSGPRDDHTSEGMGAAPEAAAADAECTFFHLGHGFFVVTSSRHADFVVDLRRNSRRPTCRVVRDGWPRAPTHAALFERHAATTCLGAERSSTAALGVVVRKQKTRLLSDAAANNTTKTTARDDATATGTTKKKKKKKNPGGPMPLRRRSLTPASAEEIEEALLASDARGGGKPSSVIIL
eukprot:CAMPEP_0118890472 /NCGR_PEP_ID=MMETSP1166-20130328/919_1 /TAXON_ID=1104430 /ORGANISM="Chrysoreinhardia sp, Strain CCMP3193" /LENGTH=666 /DNA_ID=CAMNT_0006829085 /DNA_START=15 /DNA_END=2015 /DNA_ORIENTATION=+